MVNLRHSLNYPFDREKEWSEQVLLAELSLFENAKRIPCLMCGNLNKPGIHTHPIKEEVSEYFEEYISNAQVCNECVAEDTDYTVFEWFLKWFGIQIVEKEKQRFGWDGVGGSALLFCANCKPEMMRILHLQKDGNESKEKLNKGLIEIKEKMASFEGTFQRKGIYEKDDRYKKVRSQVSKFPNNKVFLVKRQGKSSNIDENLSKSDANTVCQVATTSASITRTAPSQMQLCLEQSADNDQQLVSKTTEVSFDDLSEIKVLAEKLQDKTLKNIVREAIPIRRSIRIRTRMIQMKIFIRKSTRIANRREQKILCIRKSVKIQKKVIHEKLYVRKFLQIKRKLVKKKKGCHKSFKKAKIEVKKEATDNVDSI